MISIVIPHKNTVKYLASTLRSIENQLFDEYEVIVQDGGSSPEVIIELNRIAFEFGKIQVHVEPDQSIYDGISKGFDKCRGDIVTYINSGDEFMPNAFRTVQGLQKEGIDYLIISRRCIKCDNFLVLKKHIRYRRLFIKLGLYGSLCPFVQQEGTFFSRSLWKKMDPAQKRIFANFSLAGDFYLWNYLAHNKIAIISPQEPLAFFLVHPGQLSENIDRYRNEMLLVFKDSLFLKTLHKTIFALRGVIRN